jgi:hypothetical protein
MERLYPFITRRAHDWSPDGLLVTSKLDRDAIDFISSGGAALLLAGKDSLEAEREFSFLPSHGGAIGTMIQDHPALRGFPHGQFCDLEFFNLMEDSGAVSLPSVAKAPIIGAVRTANGWLSANKDLTQVAQLFEVRAGRGRLLATTMRIRENFDEAYPETIYLFDRLLRYALSADFDPKTEISKEQLTKLARQ